MVTDNGSERVNTTMDRELRDRFEAWRAAQYRQTGRVPALADAARILIHKGLVADGFGADTENAPEGHQL